MAELTDNEMYDDIMQKLRHYFKDDEGKVMQWTATENPMFGFITPASLIRSGRIRVVWRCVNNAIDGIHP